MSMSVAQVTQAITQMSEDEQFLVAAFLQHLADERDPQHAVAMEAANQRIESGKSVSLEELMVMHEELERRGR